MKVCGFTIVRNAIKFDYPAVEAIRSLLPVCDKFIVCVGNSDDGTRALIESINDPKIEIIDTVWDDSLRKGGAVLAVETNKAFDAIPAEYDWAFYIQADEVVHEKYHAGIVAAMHQHLANTEVEGLLFKYTHFYGNYKYIGDSRQWYRREIRIIRNRKDIRSHGDAQGFRVNNLRKLQVKLIDAYIYHYGWVRNPSVMKSKQESFNQLWAGDKEIDVKILKEMELDLMRIDSLALFSESHPQIMKERIARRDWDWTYDVSKKNFNFKKAVLYKIEKWTGKRLFEYQNYKLV
jgi:hypothetical protein